ncbi:MAG: hypothetical protein HOW97_09305 [Catenulispora sp.]|nr:hypothetical protein [Catenulispora sp.]
MRARVAELEASGKLQTAPKRHRVRSLFSALLILLAWILAPLSVAAAWSAATVGDTSRYVSTVSPLATNPDIQAALANRVTNTVMGELDIAALAQQITPDDRPRLEALLQKASGPITSALTSFVHDRTLNVLSSSWFAAFWDDANRAAHSSVNKLLTGQGGGALKLQDGAVAVDLGPLVDRVKAQLVADGITVAGKIPEVHTSFTIMQAKNINQYRTWFRLLQIAGDWLPFIFLACAAGGVLLAADRRRALVVTGVGVFVAAGLIGIGVRLGRTFYLNALPGDVSQPAASAVYDTMTRYLITTCRTVAILGLLVALAAWLSGPSRPAVIVRGFWHVGIDATRQFADRLGMKTGPVGGFVRRYRSWITWGAVLIAAVVLLLWHYPTGLVVLWLAIACLAVMLVVEFLADRPGPTPGGGTSR